jgi:transposase
MKVMKQTTKSNYTPKQLKMPLEIERIIEIDDAVYSFSEIMDRIDLSKYLVKKDSKMGRKRCDGENLLKIILFCFMENGYASLRYLVKRGKTDIRYMWLLDGMKAPSHMKFANFINEELTDAIEEIFLAINRVIIEEEGVDLEHVYLDGTKIEANANKYTWVWKKSCQKNRDKVFEKVTDLISRMNEKTLALLGVKIEPRSEYAVEYLEELLTRYQKATGINPESFVKGKGHHKSLMQHQYQEMEGYIARLKRYAEHIEVCGEKRNSYSKTDHGATFMRVKRDYMGNDQLLPAYNMQTAVCNGYIAVMDVQQYASDMDCFVPLMEKFNGMYGHYPKYPVADAGYGSYNNYLYCQEKGMEKFMKFTMYNKETKDAKYRADPYRSVNFKQDADGNLICPNGKKFIHKATLPVRGNKYGRTEDVYECESCEGCPFKEKCSPKAKGNRTIRMNQELTSLHQEVIENLQSIHGALLCMNRSIEAEGTFGVMKWNRSYKRAFRRGLKNVKMEFLLLACGFNLYKYHNSRMKKRKTGTETEAA